MINRVHLVTLFFLVLCLMTVHTSNVQAEIVIEVNGEAIPLPSAACAAAYTDAMFQTSSSPTITIQLPPNGTLIPGPQYVTDECAPGIEDLDAVAKAIIAGAIVSGGLPIHDLNPLRKFDTLCKVFDFEGNGTCDLLNRYVAKVYSTKQGINPELDLPYGPSGERLRPPMIQNDAIDHQIREDVDRMQQYQNLIDHHTDIQLKTDERKQQEEDKIRRETELGQEQIRQDWKQRIPLFNRSGQ
jgi:hypothetical protein